VREGRAVAQLEEILSYIAEEDLAAAAVLRIG
jgi:hypothetical protein